MDICVKATVLEKKTPMKNRFNNANRALAVCMCRIKANSKNGIIEYMQNERTTKELNMMYGMAWHDTANQH